LGFGSAHSTAPPLDGGMANGTAPYLGRWKITSGWTWDLYGWFAMASGIFLRSALNLPNLDWRVDALTWRSFLAAVVVSLAAFGPFMRWLNRRHRLSGLQMLSAPFTFGFLLSLGEFGAKSLLHRFM